MGDAMPRKPAKPAKSMKKAAPRRRRSAEEARSAILDAAEKRLVASGPAGIRLQEVAGDVGVSHPTVLHHFGNREALVEAVVARALESLKLDLLGAMRALEAPPLVRPLLDQVFDTLVQRGHARALLWLALSGHEPMIDQLHVREVSEATHEIRRMRRKELGKPPPVFEDTYFTVLLPALALLAMAVIAPPELRNAADDVPFGAGRFRAWLADLVHAHLENG
jgi:AcrR family transcriptional regulator